MNAHERALELAAARVDFAPTTSEREFLHSHLDTCTPCRGDADGVAEDARRLVARPVHRLAPERVAAMRLSLERPRRGMSPAMVLVAAALLLVAGIATAAVGAGIVRRLDESRLAVLPGPSVAVVSPGPSAGPAESPFVPKAWTMTDAGTLAPGLPFAPATVAGSDGAWVAVGGQSCVEAGDGIYDCAALVGRSNDGRAWDSAVVSVPIATGYFPPSSGPLAGMDDVAAGPDGFVAVGFGSVAGDRGVHGMVWWSADGMAWEAVQLGAGARPSAVLRAPDRWLIGGVIYGNLAGATLADAKGPIGAIWSSVDGRAWTLIEDAATFDIGGYVDTMEDPASGGIQGFARNGTMIVAGGQVCADTGRPCAAAVWTSPDGVSWGRVSQLPVGDWISDVVSANGTFVAVAERCVDSACKAVVFRSDDGRTWSEVPMDLPETARIGSTGTTIVLVSGDYRTLDVRASADGAAWTSLGSVTAPERVNWGAPILVARSDGVIDVLIRFDPLDPQESEADVYTTTWTIAPAP